MFWFLYIYLTCNVLSHRYFFAFSIFKRSFKVNKQGRKKQKDIFFSLYHALLFFVNLFFKTAFELYIVKCIQTTKIHQKGVMLFALNTFFFYPRLYIL